MDTTVGGDGVKRAAEFQVDVKRNKFLVKSDQSAGGDETGVGMEEQHSNNVFVLMENEVRMNECMSTG